MPPLPKGTCIRCRKTVALRTSGVIREHTIARVDGPKRCPGVSMRPLEALKAKPALVTDNERRVADLGGSW
jgi:hypothetical protein